MKRTRAKRLKEFIGKLGVSVFGAAVALLPTWLFLLIRHFMSPVGFWQNLILTGVGLYFLGFIQFCLIIGLIAFLVPIWSEY